MKRRPTKHLARQKGGCFIWIFSGLSILAFSVSILIINPDYAAHGADFLRTVAGDQLVAWLETTIYDAEDQLKQAVYQHGLLQTVAPWSDPNNSGLASSGLSPTDSLILPDTADNEPTPVPTQSSAMLPTQPAMHQLAPTPTPLMISDQWQPPAAIERAGGMVGAGQWTPYIADEARHVLAYRTYLQPDPARPYVYVAVVAIDIHATRLHFVLGNDEPKSNVTIDRPGTIPDADLHNGKLLAAFNGGFKARHGHFGVMLDQTTIIPPRDHFATVAAYRDGSVQIGAWGTDITASPDLLFWRQNGPLLIDHGVLNPHTADITSQDWGIILKGVTAVWRSGLGISADQKTLYYLAGDSMTISTLAHAFQMLHAPKAMQLDINAVYVHFDAFSKGKDGLRELRLMETMRGAQDRFQHPYDRDFFYLTLSS